MVQIQKINNHKVKPVPIDDLDPDNDKPVKGADILPEIYSNVFILAKKKSGKSTLTL